MRDDRLENASLPKAVLRTSLNDIPRLTLLSRLILAGFSLWRDRDDDAEEEEEEVLEEVLEEVFEYVDSDVLESKK